jgi:hypothetical protein
MKSKLLIIAGAFLIVAFVLRSVEKPVFAQIRAALMQNIDEPGRNAFGLSGQYGSFPVPAGQRYVIEQYTVQCDVDNTTSMSDITLLTTTNGVLVEASAVPHFVRSNGGVNSHPINLWIGTGTGHFYADGGGVIGFAVYTSAGGGIEDCYYSVSGYAIHNP